MKRKTKIILITLLCIFIVLIGVVFALGAFVNSIFNADFIKFGENKINTLKVLDESYKISKFYTSTENGLQTKICTYTNIPNQTNVLYEYVNILRKEEGFLVTTNADLKEQQGSVQLAKESLEEGKIIIVRILWTTDEFIISYQHGVGTVTLK